MSLTWLVEDRVKIGAGWSHFVRGNWTHSLNFGHYLGLLYREKDSSPQVAVSFGDVCVLLVLQVNGEEAAVQTPFRLSWILFCIPLMLTPAGWLCETHHENVI